MNENLHDEIDDVFKKGLEDHTELPSEKVWDQIDTKLDKKKVISISRKYNKLKWAAAVLLIFSIGMAMYTIHLHLKNKELADRNKNQKELPGPDSRINNNPEQKNNSIERKNPSNEKLNNNSRLPKNGNQKSGIVGNADKNSPSNGIGSQNVNQGLSKSHINATTNPEIKANNAGNNLNKIQSSKKNQSLALLHRSQVNIKPAGGTRNLPGNKKEIFAKNDEIRNSRTTVDREQENQAGISFSSTREKNIEGILLLPEQENSFGEITAKPLMPDFKRIIEANAMIKPSFRKATGQSSQKSGLPSRFSAAIYFSPDIVSTSLKNDNDRYHDEDRNEIKKEEQNNFSFTTGILVAYKFSNRITLESGFTFSSWETNIHPKIIYARPENNGDYNYKFNCSAGYSYLDVKSLPAPRPGDSLMALNSNNTIQYAGVPIKMRYAIKKGRFSIIPEIGFSANFLIKGQLKTSLSTTAGIQKMASNLINGLKPFYVSGLASIGAQYAINNKLEFAFLPTARFSITSINKNAPVKTNLYTLGFASGLVYEF
jgi:hypothetical protein